MYVKIPSKGEIVLTELKNKATNSDTDKNTEHRIFKIFRVFMITVATIFFLWFLLPVFVYGILNAFNTMGMLACLYVIAFFSARNAFKEIKAKLYEKKLTKLLWQTGRFCIYSFALYCFLISVVMAVFASIPPTENSSEIILGAQVKGTAPSLSLYDRIMAGEEYLKENPKSICVATGGLGDTATITEAQCISNVLTEHGIAQDRIYLENNSKNTQENIKFAYSIIKENGENENIAIVSDAFHQARARLIARKLGISSQIGAVSAKTNWIYLPTFWIREWFALPYDAFFR